MIGAQHYGAAAGARIIFSGLHGLEMRDRRRAKTAFIKGASLCERSGIFIVCFFQGWSFLFERPRPASNIDLSLSAAFFHID
jgi:hypothetical protein